MNRTILYLIFGVILITFYGCNDENPIDSEQYFKQIYLVGAVDGMVTKKVNYAGESEIFTSVASSGSLNIDRDVTVVLKDAPEGVDIYNQKNLSVTDIKYQQLSSSSYHYSPKAVIKKGDVYTLIPISVNPEGLHCDSLYVIPLQIENVSEYKIAQKDTILLIHLDLVNDFSGSYQSSFTRTDISTGKFSDLSMSRTLTAVNANTVRFVHEISETIENVKPNGVNISVNSDNTLKISPWENFNLTSGGGKYIPEMQKFEYWYEYNIGTVSYRVEGTLTRNITI